MGSSIVNLNTIRLRELEHFFRAQISRCDTANKIVSYALDDTDDFSGAFSDLLDKDGGAGLINIEDEFNLALEKVLSELDDILNVFIDDSYENFGSVDLSFEDGIRLIPGYAAAENLLPCNSEGFTVFETLGFSTGHVWGPKDISLLINHIQKGSVQDSIDELDIRADIVQLLHIYQAEQRFLSERALKKELFNLRKCRERLGHIYPLLVNCINPEASFIKKSRWVDVRDIINPLREAQYEKRVMEEFSFNDFSHDSFFLLAKQIVEQFSDESVFRSRLIESFGNYRDTITSLREHPLWKEYQMYESVWYQDIEQLFLAMNFAYGSIDADDPIRWQAHTETARYQAAKALWDSLEHSAYDALFLFRRGCLIRENQWEMMKNIYVGAIPQAQLEEIGGLELFERALDAEHRALEIMGKIIVPDEKTEISPGAVHKDIREKRFNLNAALVWARRLIEE